MKLSKKDEKRTVNVVPMPRWIMIIERTVFKSSAVHTECVFLTREEVRKLADYVQSLPALEEKATA